MPIKIPNSLPATGTLEAENIFVMTELRALQQDIRPLRLVILNLMPTKIAMETQLLRMLSNTPLQIEVDLIQTSTYTSKNTPSEHLLTFYKTFNDIRHQQYDGMIITGAPVENMPFEEVAYWPELCEIMEWARKNDYSTFFICWGAQAALYYYYGIQKRPLPEKMFGIFPHNVLNPKNPLVRGFDEIYYAPHSRHTEVRAEDIEAVPSLELLSTSPIAGFYLAASRDGRRIFCTGHSEYDRETLATEYFRDVNKGLPIKPPYNYFPNDDPAKSPPHVWRSHANLLYVNWLNYFVYQSTPYDLSNLEKSET